MLPTSRRPALRVYLVIATATGLLFATYGTLAAIYRIQEAGLNPLQLVLVGTVLETAVFLFEIPTGVVADTVSRRRSVIIGIFVIGAGFLLEGMFPVFVSILVAQAVWGLGYTFISGAEEAWIADELGDEETTAHAFLWATQIGQVMSLVGIGAAVALASISLRLPLIVAGIGYGLLGIFLLRAMPEDHFPGDGDERSTTWESLATTLRAGIGLIRRNRVVTLLIVAMFFEAAFSETFDRLWEAHLLDNFEFPSALDWTPIVWFGVIDAAALLLSAAATAIVRRRLGHRSLEVIPMVVTGLVAALTTAVIALGLAGEFFLAVAFYQAAVLIRVVNAPLLRAWVSALVDSRVRATVFSVHSQSNAIGQVAGGPLLGWLATAASLRAAFVVAGVVLAPAAVIYGIAAGSRRSVTDG